ncbi:MAG: HU family DNA-binding protein [Candidatus Bostrichicola ureolyticus]|nr:MAG: HU family DNA-binding protein [Candidatus Bostrichicola ureolyticus]
MNKTELIDIISAKTGLTKVIIKNIIEAFISSVKDTLCKGERISLIGFITLFVVERNARNAINPRTKVKIYIPKKKVVKVKIGTELNNLINK